MLVLRCGHLQQRQRKRGLYLVPRRLLFGRERYRVFCVSHWHILLHARSEFVSEVCERDHIERSGALFGVSCRQLLIQLVAMCHVSLRQVLQFQWRLGLYQLYGRFLRQQRQCHCLRRVSNGHIRCVGRCTVYFVR